MVEILLEQIIYNSSQKLNTVITYGCIKVQFLEVQILSSFSTGQRYEARCCGKLNENYL